MTDESQEHAIWSPSSAHGWRRCPDRINAERGRPDRVGIEAAEGTLFHEHAEIALRLDLDPQYFRTGEPCVIDGHKVAFNHEMAGHLAKGLEYVKYRCEEYGGNHKPIVMVEQRVRIEPWTGEPNGFGTSDLCIIFPSLRKIIVFDWKYGKIAVSPVKNDQLWLYCLGCWQSFAGEIFGWDPTDITVELIIWQPRIPGGGGSWETTMEEVLVEGEKIKADAAATREPNPPRIAGPIQCKYCKAKGDCGALAKYNLELYSLHFDDIADDLEHGIEVQEPDIKGWSDEQKAWVILHHKMFERWFKALQAEALEQMLRGNSYPLLKVIKGPQGNRFWKDEDAAKRALINMLGQDKVVKEVILTPPQAQRELGVNDEAFNRLMGAYIDRPPGKPTLVPATDPRDPMPTLGEEFDKLLLDDEDEDNGEV